jgi:hypothetical protein
LPGRGFPGLALALAVSLRQAQERVCDPAPLLIVQGILERPVGMTAVRGGVPQRVLEGVLVAD